MKLDFMCLLFFCVLYCVTCDLVETVTEDNAFLTIANGSANDLVDDLSDLYSDIEDRLNDSFNETFNTPGMEEDDLPYNVTGSMLFPHNETDADLK